ncbi:MAG: hypothetical protein AAGA22_04745 [Pseudomonadota bacterium]
MTCVLPEFYKEKLVTARKPHTCCETGRTIEAGQQYWRCEGRWEYGFASYIQTVEAYHFARWLNHNYFGSWECTVGFECVRDAVLESRDPDLAERWDRVMSGRPHSDDPKEAAR